MQKLEHILKHHDLRTTQVRLDILSYFQKSESALSHADLETHFEKKLSICNQVPTSKIFKI